jgi:SecD/SecF fusion protein
MSRSDWTKLLIVVIATILAGVYLYPSYRYYTLSPAERQSLPADKLAELRKRAVHLGLDLQGGMHLVLEVDRSRLGPAEAKDAPERAMEIIRNRIDQFGVAEPLVQREGEDRIVIQLPGLTDRQRAIDLIGKTALLELKLVRTPEERVREAGCRPGRARVGRSGGGFVHATVAADLALPGARELGIRAPR